MDAEEKEIWGLTAKEFFREDKEYWTDYIF